MRRIETAAAMIWLLGACEEPAPPPASSYRDPMAPVSLWPIPNASGPVVSVPAGGRGGAPAEPHVSKFDPEEVYLIGTFGAAGCLRKAVVRFDAPELVSPGIDCAVAEATLALRPADGRLLYIERGSEDIRALQCEDCVYARVDGPFLPAALAESDPVGPTACGTATAVALMAGADGRIAVHCTGGNWWRAPGAVYNGILPCENLRSLGPAGTGLLSDAVLVAQGTALRWTLPPERQLHMLVARARSDHYWAVFDGAQPQQPELYRVGLDATLTLEGTFPPLPPDAVDTAVVRSALDGQGRLVQLLHDLRVARRGIDGESEIVYDPPSSTQFRPTMLVTGP